MFTLLVILAVLQTYNMVLWWHTASRGNYTREFGPGESTTNALIHSGLLAATIIALVYWL